MADLTAFAKGRIHGVGFSRDDANGVPLPPVIRFWVGGSIVTLTDRDEARALHEGLGRAIADWDAAASAAAGKPKGEPA